MAERSRLEELERRVTHDPASIAFAQLAEEYRRAGRVEDAVRVCRAGLNHHPTYLSARVTLGRALMTLEHYSEATRELEAVIREAPDHLSALRTLAELHELAGGQAIAESGDLALATSPDDEALTSALSALDDLDLRGVRAGEGFEPSELDMPDGLRLPEFADGSSSFDPDVVLGAIEEISPPAESLASPPGHLTMWQAAVPAEPPSRHELDGTVHLVLHPEPAREEPALAALETWLAAIVNDRASRG